MKTNTLKHIETLLGEFDKPAVLCSFGKDSMVLLHLVHKIDKSIPIIFWRDPFMQSKNKFAYKIIQSMNLEVYDYPPSGADFCYNNGEMNIIYRQDTGGGLGIFWLRGLIDSDKSLCLFKDFMQRPLVNFYKYRWNLTFSGHKASDIDPMLGGMRLEDMVRPIGRTVLFYPLKNWSDEDIWDYIHKYKVPYNVKRYDENNNTCNNDYYECCYACVNPDREDDVFCHKDNKTVKNYGKQIDYKQKINDIRILTGV